MEPQNSPMDKKFIALKKKKKKKKLYLAYPNKM